MAAAADGADEEVVEAGNKGQGAAHYRLCSGRGLYVPTDAQGYLWHVSRDMESFLTACVQVGASGVGPSVSSFLLLDLLPFFLPFHLHDSSPQVTPTTLTPLTILQVHESHDSAPLIILQFHALRTSAMTALVVNIFSILKR